MVHTNKLQILEFLWYILEEDNQRLTEIEILGGFFFFFNVRSAHSHPVRVLKTFPSSTFEKHIGDGRPCEEFCVDSSLQVRNSNGDCYC